MTSSEGFTPTGVRIGPRSGRSRAASAPGRWLRPRAQAEGNRLQSRQRRSARRGWRDAGCCQRGVWNLRANAIRATAVGGGGAVRVELGDARAEIVVSDTGRGIRPDFLPAVFE